MNQFKVLIWIIAIIITWLLLQSCRTRQVSMDRNKTHVSIDSTHKKVESETKKDSTKTDSTSKEKTLDQSEEEISIPADSVKINHNTQETTFYNNGKPIIIKRKINKSTEKETSKSVQNNIQTASDKQEESTLSLDSTSNTKSKDGKTSGASFGGVAVVSVFFIIGTIAIGSLWAYLNHRRKLRGK